MALPRQTEETARDASPLTCNSERAILILSLGGNGRMGEIPYVNPRSYKRWYPAWPGQTAPSLMAQAMAEPLPFTPNFP